MALSNAVVKTATIRQVKPGKWKIYSEKGKPISKEYTSLEAAQKRLDEIEMFKHMEPKKKEAQTTWVLPKETKTRMLFFKEVASSNDKIASLRRLAKDFRLNGDDALAKQTLKVLAAETGNEETQADLSYSHIMRTLRKGDKEKLREFQRTFKDAFDAAFDEGMEEESEAVALMEATQKIDYEG